MNYRQTMHFELVVLRFLPRASNAFPQKHLLMQRVRLKQTSNNNNKKIEKYEEHKNLLVKNLAYLAVRAKIAH